MSIIGIHVSNIFDIIRTIKENPELNQINLIQLFVNATTNYADKKYSRELEYIKNHKIRLVIHGSYTINLSKRWSSTDWWIRQFIGEIESTNQIGGFGIVIHTGKQMDLSNGEAINNMYTALLHIHKETEKYNVKIILETASGQGTETLTKIEDFCKFMQKFYTHPDKIIQQRFGVCIDTCHIFAAGHDIRSKTDMNRFFSTIDSTIGIDKIKLCQINDSRKGLGSKLDRHMNIGDGMIGQESILRITKFMKELGVPIVLETPSGGLIKDYLLLKNA
jgi:deoxyribonuclease IV